jgi:hypothetical protein
MAKKAAAPKAKPARSMTDEHKAALAEGREQGRAVRRYLEAIEAHKPRRGRKRSADSMERRLAAIEEELAEADPLNRVHLSQERIDLQRQLAAGTENVDIEGLEAEFVAAAGAYSDRKGISYDAWRAVGVEARVLKAAGIGRGH